MKKGRRNQGIKKTLVTISFCAAAVIAFVLFISYQLGKNLDEWISKASAENVRQTYSVQGNFFIEFANSHFNYLRHISEYIEDTKYSDEEIFKRIKGYQEDYGFTDFYFVSESGEYLSIEKYTGYIDFGKNIFDLLKPGESFIVDGSLPDKKNMVFFVRTVPEESIFGFKYCALAFGYSKADIQDEFQTESYSKSGTSFVCYQSGKVIFTLGPEKLNVRNIFTLLESSDLSKSQKLKIEKDFKAEKNGSCTLVINNVRYILDYQAFYEDSWILASFTPEEEVNVMMNSVRRESSKVSMFSLSVIFFFLCVFLVYSARKIVGDKNSMIREREILFSVMARNMNEIYMLYDMEKDRTLFISENIGRLLGIDYPAVLKDTQVIRKCFNKGEEFSLRHMLDDAPFGEMLEKEIEMINVKTKQSFTYLLSVFRSPTADSFSNNLAVVIFSDRTKEELVRREIEAAMDLSKAASAAKSAFLSNMSHDIRTPMNAVVGFTALLEKDADNAEKVRAYTKKIAGAGQYLLGIIDDILDMTKIESGKMSLNLSSFNIKSLVADVETITRGQAELKGQTFEVKLALDYEGKIEADRVRLQQVLTNLLSNAVKYTPEGGKILLFVSSDSETGSFIRHHFVVEDNGIGMSKEYIKKVFEPFSREVNSVVNGTQGTGLGMSITKNLVELMGGFISVESEEGEGTRFSVDLEFKPRYNLGADGLKTTPQAYSLNGLKILAAEDNELNKEILSELLAVEKVERCDIVSNGREAVEAFAASAPGYYDLILMDVQMPVMNGYEATRSIRKLEHPNAKTIPVIAMTANTFAEDVDMAIKSGMDAHIPKPLDMKVLKTRLAAILKK